MNLQKNDKIELYIDDLTSEGSGVGHYNDMAVFVYGAVPDDTIIAHIIKVSKRYAIGKIDEIIKKSNHRCEIDCPVSSQCGGCAFRQMTYEKELEYKQNKVDEALKRIGHLDVKTEFILGADNTNRYRNKAQTPVFIDGDKLVTGFYANKSHRIISCNDCLLEPDEFTALTKAFATWVKTARTSSYNEETGKGLIRHLYYRKAFGTGEIMVCVVINGDTVPKMDELISLLRESVPNIKSICLNINKAKTNVVVGKETKVVWGSETIEDELLSLKFVISPESFYQINHDQCEKLYALVDEFATPKEDETILDLYCGAGTIGLTLAKKVKSLVGVEIVSSAIKNAVINAKKNNINNAYFFCADAQKASLELIKKKIIPTTVIVDPPRKGCDRAVLDAIDTMNPKKIVYVSCDPATLARDLEILTNKNYKIERIAAVDMFPRTPHVEAVVLMSRV